MATSDVNGPRSMPSGKGLLESRSLWNYTASPGWSAEELEVMNLAIQKYGMGNWSTLLKEEVLPGKTMAQMNLQCQRMVGQQSLGEFMGIHLDTRKVLEYNKSLVGAKRKNGLVINTGPNPTPESRRLKRMENEKKYGIPEAQYVKIEVPKLEAKHTERLNTVRLNGRRIVLDTAAEKELWATLNHYRRVLTLLDKEAALRAHNTRQFEREKAGEGSASVMEPSSATTTTTATKTTTTTTSRQPMASNPTKNKKAAAKSTAKGPAKKKARTRK